MQTTELPDIHRIIPRVKLFDYVGVKESLTDGDLIQALEYAVESNLRGKLPLLGDVYNDAPGTSIHTLRSKKLVTKLPVLRLAKEYGVFRNNRFSPYEMPDSLKFIETYLEDSFMDGSGNMEIGRGRKSTGADRYPHCLLANVKIGSTPAFSSIFSYTRIK